MEQEYKTSVFGKIFYGLGALVLLAFTIWIPFNGKNGPNDPYPNYIMPLVIGMAVTIMVVINLIKRKVVICDHSIKYVSVWGIRELENTNVKGFRILDKSITIYPADNHSSKIKIRDYLSIADEDKLQSILKERYTDLDAVGYKNNLDEIYNNAELGGDKEQRITSFEHSKLVAQIYNGGGIAIFISNLIFNNFVFNNDVAKAIPVIYVLAGLVVLMKSKGLIKLIARRSSAYYSIIYGMYPAVISALVVMISYYDFVSDKALFIPVIIATIIIGALSLRFGYDKSENAVKAQIPAFIGLSVLYAIPLVTLINCKLDASLPNICNSKIQNRYIMHNYGRSYFHVVIDASGFSSANPSKDLHISQDLYDRVESMQAVHIAVKPGLLHIPWFYINE